ncbi:hypothetical protein CLAFUW4_12181 [Fulvia fulva]|uniref:Uncharacterized protein n=1 Tax=Passalora fulva TaxID=5499 RepID=A0A9Q8PEY6_PASFU|nr:uncharacterized protein CLAFUR5_11218 [Fulvia fulva]KAK4617785.1 hypothetical protein CLAFUR4_12186 [Fulvia fulva]KAK4618600.1 hypothetical protein CLAFUR0_12197 [Fulvia fulva]UJO21223.1 hypothetical protein CLAFUR5_11218 [Fulvia fulva]WPV18329.1 hypothetical protein CLAFUW4_12181 [Fulvia fulva]WPV33251.1 hypothetical protein CLAFUW7_12188 [Fulvia fulva]
MLGEELLWLAKVGEDGMPPELLTVAPELLLDRDEATEKPEDDMLNVLIPEDDIVSGTTELGGDTIDALGGGTVDLLDEIILDCVVTGPADELLVELGFVGTEDPDSDPAEADEVMSP